MTHYTKNVKLNFSSVRFNFVFIMLLMSLLLCYSRLAAKEKKYEIKSPNNTLSVKIIAGKDLKWSVNDNKASVILPSEISLQLKNGEILGKNVSVKSARKVKKDTYFKAVNYIKSVVKNNYNQITLNFRKGFGVIFRVYNDAVAYRFFTRKKGEIIIKNEEANFNFAGDRKAFIPIVNGYRDNQIFCSSFEALYRHIHISQFPKDSLAFLPVLVNVGNNRKVVILEADLENYPGMYLNENKSGTGFTGVFAPYPLKCHNGGWKKMEVIPVKRADYIAKTKGTRDFPWRVIAISQQDKQLLNNDIIQKLAAPPRIKDLSWIKPGQVSWDWWNDWNITHVNFKAGINIKTYKYYIDFASANHIPYIIMDEGWSTLADLTKINPKINLKEIINYGKQKGVGVILWAIWKTVRQQMDTAFPLYSKMGVKGFKIDFIDRDDQKAVASTFNIAKTAAKYHLLIDYHGIFKPTGLQRTYPNVVNNEGVRGLEYMKWSDVDATNYVVSLPFIRMLAGPMDYTPGAMRNATKADFRAINNNPMSQGTRCLQMALYVMYYAPLQMLADNPTIYMKNQECTNFITSVPTTFDETVPLAGKVGQYAAVARRKGNTWFVGAITNWTERNLTLDFSFLKQGTYKAVIFEDGVNADRNATDYKKVTMKITAGEKLKIHLAQGGGWAARLERIN